MSSPLHFRQTDCSRNPMQMKISMTNHFCTDSDIFVIDFVIEHDKTTQRRTRSTTQSLNQFSVGAVVFYWKTSPTISSLGAAPKPKQTQEPEQATPDIHLSANALCISASSMGWAPYLSAAGFTITSRLAYRRQTASRRGNDVNGSIEITTTWRGKQPAVRKKTSLQASWFALLSRNLERFHRQNQLNSFSANPCSSTTVIQWGCELAPS